MSANKKPENLLAEILYSRKRVHASYYKDGKLTHGDEHASLFGVGLADKCVQKFENAIKSIRTAHRDLQTSIEKLRTIGDRLIKRP